jgi:hypothetical protein
LCCLLPYNVFKLDLDDGGGKRVVDGTFGVVVFFLLTNSDLHVSISATRRSQSWPIKTGKSDASVHVWTYC